MVGEKLGKSPYDALVDEYEPGATSAELDIIFDEVAQFLPNLLSEVIEYQNAQEPIVFPRRTLRRGNSKADWAIGHEGFGL